MRVVILTLEGATAVRTQAGNCNFASPEAMPKLGYIYIYIQLHGRAYTWHIAWCSYKDRKKFLPLESSELS